MGERPDDGDDAELTHLRHSQVTESGNSNGAEASSVITGIRIYGLTSR